MALPAAIIATPVVGMFCQNLSSYEVIANLEVNNRTSNFMNMVGYKMECGVSEHPPMNIGGNEILRCGFHKTNWSVFGVEGEITWTLDSKTRVEISFYVHYNSLVNFEDNELKLAIITDGERRFHKIEGEKMASVTNGIVTVKGTIGNSNHSTIRVDVF